MALGGAIMTTLAETWAHVTDTNIYNSIVREFLIIQIENRTGTLQSLRYDLMRTDDMLTLAKSFPANIPALIDAGLIGEVKK